MLRHFIAGNFWLFVALALFVGKESVRTQPTRVAFFGEGNWFKPGAYMALVIASAVIGVFFFLRGADVAKQEKAEPEESKSE